MQEQRGRCPDELTVRLDVEQTVVKALEVCKAEIDRRVESVSKLSASRNVGFAVLRCHVQLHRHSKLFVASLRFLSAP